jgi:hypothetical protein
MNRDDADAARKPRTRTMKKMTTKRGLRKLGVEVLRAKGAEFVRTIHQLIGGVDVAHVGQHAEPEVRVDPIDRFHEGGGLVHELADVAVTALFASTKALHEVLASAIGAHIAERTWHANSVTQIFFPNLLWYFV